MIEPVLHRLLVKPDSVEETDEVLKKAKQMGFHLPEKEVKREQAAAESGVVISLGSTCFKDYGGDLSLVPVGSRVYYAKYSGKTVKDVDGTEYVCLKDEDVVCIIKEDA